MKLDPRLHQLKAFELQYEREYYALFCEQGTGKTYMVLHDVERLWLEGYIEGLLIVAPKGVHRNWIRREIPKLLELPSFCAVYESHTKRFLNRMEEMDYYPSRLKVLAINIDAIITPKGVRTCIDFLKRFPSLMVVDESQRIKNPKSARTKAAMVLGNLAEFRRITTGTAATNSPADVFSQSQFLQKGLLGTNSYRAFVAEYTELLPPEHPQVMQLHEEYCNRQGIYDLERMRNIPGPQIQARDPRGNPIYKNLDQLHALMAPYSYRVRKDECLDLPPKIYQTMEFDLLPAQRQVYEELKVNLRLELDDGRLTTIKKLALGTKLQQVTSGFILIDGEPEEFIDGNPRAALFAELVKDMETPFIVWAKFTHEVHMIVGILEKLNISCAAYVGATKPADRDRIIDEFQAGELTAIVGNAKAGGVGITLTACETMIYYSNDFSLEDRLQSEDRAHRDGLDHKVLYIDLVAANTIDERIREALQTKGNMAAAIMGEFD